MYKFKSICVLIIINNYLCISTSKLYKHRNHELNPCLLTISIFWVIQWTGAPPFH